MSLYYADEWVTLYHGDCREVLPALGKFDLLLTDPPYGIGSIWKGGGKHGWSKAAGDSAVRNEWDAAAPDSATLDMLLASARDAVIWGGNYFPLRPSRGWLVWNKPERNFTLAEAELAWTSRDMVIRVADLPRSEFGREHPTQKPLSLMHWCLRFFPEARSVIDPYAGSGTSLVAAKGAGLRAVGIEAHEPYCEIAAKRLTQDVLDFEVASPQKTPQAEAGPRPLRPAEPTPAPAMAPGKGRAGVGHQSPPASSRRLRDGRRVGPVGDTGVRPARRPLHPQVQQHKPKPPAQPLTTSTEGLTTRSIP